MKDSNGILDMKQKDTSDLSIDLFQLIKRFFHLDLRLKAIDGLTRSEQELLLMLFMNYEETGKSSTVTGISSLLQITPAGVTQLGLFLNNIKLEESSRDPHRWR